MPNRITLLLPKTTSVSLRVVIVVLAGAMLALAANWIVMAFSGEWTIWPLLMAAPVCFVAVHLWMLKSWTRSVAKFIIGVYIVFGILGTFNPFFAGDYAAEHGGDMPDWTTLAAIVGPLVALGLWCFHVLDKCKAEFN